MSFFDQHYYAINKSLMSRIGIWPEQSSYVRNVWPLMILSVIILSLVGPQLIQLHKIGGDLEALITCLPIILGAVVSCTTVLNSIMKTDKMKLMLKQMEAHWKILKNTSAVIVLKKYAERGRFLTTIYTIYIYISLVFVLFIPMVPIILDCLDPLNKTRPKVHIFEAEYGIDPNQYFWPILAHDWIVTVLAISIFVAIDTMYIMWVEHACALFEIVGFKLKMTTVECKANRKNAVTIHDDAFNYKIMYDCINFHKEAISFAGMIENVYSGSLIVVIGISTITISITGVQIMINMDHPEAVLQIASFLFGQTFHLWFNNIPGQKLIDHSLRVHSFACDIDWYNMPLKAQKLLIPIMIRSKKPCRLTAGKVYVLSMESYGAVMQTAVSYFAIFYQLY